MFSSSRPRSPLLSTAQVAKWLGISPRTLCLWAECGEIPAMKVGRHWRFREDAIKEWLDNRGSTDKSSRGPVS